jgi:hypothetical protein
MEGRKKMVVFNDFPLSTLPDFAEVIIKRLSIQEVREYRKKAKLCSFEEVDVKNLKEWLVVNLGNWFLVRWA